MALENLNIKDLLTQQVQTDLQRTQSYSVLRSNTLNMQPIQTIITPLVNNLQTIANEDKTQATARLTQRAHDLQIAQDEAERLQDNQNTLAYQQERTTLESNQSRLRLELLVVEGLYLFHQLTYTNARGAWQRTREEIRHLEDEIHLIESTPHDHEGHIHHHPSHAKLPDIQRHLISKRLDLDRLYENERREFRIYFEHETNKNRIEQEINNCTARINTLNRLGLQIDARTIARANRLAARNLYPYQLTPLALSSTNADQLTQGILSAHHATNATLQRLNQSLEKQCYPIYIAQLETNITRLETLTQPEKTALATIIVKMKEHLNDKQVRQQQESELAQLQASLQNNRQSFTNKQRQHAELSNRNRDLINSIELLNSKSRSLQYQHDKLIEQRNTFSKVTLATAGIVGAGAIAAYILIHAGILAAAPAFLPIAIVVGTALLGLLMTTSVFAIMAALKEGEVSSCDEMGLDHDQEITRNQGIMTTIQNIDLPDLQRTINDLEQQVAVKTNATEAARITERLSLAEANGIQVNTPSVGSNRNGFFPEPSAPPIEYADNVPGSQFK